MEQADMSPKSICLNYLAAVTALTEVVISNIVSKQVQSDMYHFLVTAILNKTLAVLN